MFFSVDRIYEKYAVLISDDGKEIKADISVLPAILVEGDILVSSASGYVQDKEEGSIRSLRARRLLDRLFK